ncbi:MAG TPA: hypothetical protein VKY19_00830 [Ktedonosporobacter sp.]|nr:hypothetical protein [Ktedonosporobacter sp.]
MGDLDASSPVADLTSSQMNCKQDDASLPAKVTANDAARYQMDFRRFLASTYYELRMMRINAPLGQQTIIIYGAYQQATASPMFAKANQTYFEPMLHSFQLKTA